LAAEAVAGARGYHFQHVQERLVRHLQLCRPRTSA